MENSLILFNRVDNYRLRDKRVLTYSNRPFPMKFRNIFFLFFALILLFGPQCRKNKSPEEQLPPETQVGAGTFGCLVNGSAFKPKGSPLAGPILSCAYQFI